MFNTYIPLSKSVRVVDPQECFGENVKIILPDASISSALPAFTMSFQNNCKDHASAE
jgi:hypothetical protein